jgi:hypothetical protein
MENANPRIVQTVHRYGYSQREVADFLSLHYATISLENAKKDLVDIATSFPPAAPKDIGGGIFAHITKEDMDGCQVGRFSLSDPDGIVLDLCEREASRSASS